MTSIRVTVGDDVTHRAVARALVEPYPPTDSYDLEYVLGDGHVRRNGQSLGAIDDIDLVPTFELDLYDQIIARTPVGWLLHAAAIEVSGQAIVLCGPSGAGKTTLTLAFARRGHRFLTEEMVLIDRSGRVRGLPRPLHVVAGNEDGMPAPWRRVAYPIRRRDGEVCAHTLAIPSPEDLVLDSLPLRALVRMGHGAGWPVYLRQSPSATALERLWLRSLRQDDDSLSVATGILHDFGSYELSTTTPDEALALLEPLCT